RLATSPASCSCSRTKARYSRLTATAAPCASVVADAAEVDAEGAELAVQVRALHADALGELAHLAAAQEQLLLQVGALELLACLAQRQGEQVLLDERLVGRGLHGELALDLLEADLLGAAVQEQPVHEVAQLPHVVRPGVVAQAVLGGDAEAPERQGL